MCRTRTGPTPHVRLRALPGAVPGRLSRVCARRGAAGAPPRPYSTGAWPPVGRPGCPDAACLGLARQEVACVRATIDGRYGAGRAACHRTATARVQKRDMSKSHEWHGGQDTQYCKYVFVPDRNPML